MAHSGYCLPAKGHKHILIHVSSGPQQQAKHFSSFITAAYLQRFDTHATIFFNVEGVNGLIEEGLKK